MLGRRSVRTTALAAAAIALAAGCARSATTAPPADSRVTAPEQTGCADVVGVVVVPESPGTYRFEVTVRSADTGWEKYADKWEVQAPDGTVLGERVLAHPHVEEQPFTRTQSGIVIPGEVNRVRVVARDTVEGFCGEAYEVDVS